MVFIEPGCWRMGDWMEAWFRRNSGASRFRLGHHLLVMDDGSIVLAGNASEP